MAKAAKVLTAYVRPSQACALSIISQKHQVLTPRSDLPDPNLILFHSFSGPYRPLPVLFLDNHLLVQREIVVIGEDELACACLAPSSSGQGMDTPAYISNQFTDRRD